MGWVTSRGQLSIWKATRDVIGGIRMRPFPIRCGSRTKKAEAGGHLTVRADESGEWLLVQMMKHGQGAALGRFLGGATHI